MSGYGNDNQQGGGYGGGYGDGYGGGRGGGYNDGQQGGGYGGGRQQQGGYDNQQGGGNRQQSYGNQGRNDDQQGGSYGGGNQQQGYGNQGGGGGGGYGGGQRSHGGGNFGGGGGYGGDEDLSGAAQHAQQHAGDSGDSSIFSQVASFLGNNKQNIASQPVNQQDAVNAHKQFFGGGGNSNQQADSSGIGMASAMQALKMFSGGGSGGSGNTQQGNSQNAFVGVAMSQASKLFDQQSSQGNVQGNKETAVQKAGEMALKMYMQSQGGSGASGLMSMASKFL